MAPRFFVFEFITGGGLLADTEAPAGSLLTEGQAMLDAVVSDLASGGAGLSADTHGSAQPTVSVLWDHRLPPPYWSGADVCLVRDAAETAEQFARLAAAADWTVVIAPEFEGHLKHWCEAVNLGGGRWLGGPMDLVRLAADKHATAQFLESCGVPVPAGVAIGPGDAWPDDIGLPAVLKPRFGAGAIGVRRVEAADLLAAIEAAQCLSDGNTIHTGPLGRPWRLETFWPGLPASVSVLSGPAGAFVLPPTQQVLAGESGMQYQGGRWPLESNLRCRAMQLAARVIECLHAQSIGPLGYFGIDLVLGDAADGSRDAVIEVNPRFTTSYVGLRAASQVNLASVMLHLAADADHAALTNALGPIVFDGRSRSFRLDGTTVRDLEGGLETQTQPIEPQWEPHRAVASTVNGKQEVAR